MSHRNLGTIPEVIQIALTISILGEVTARFTSLSELGNLEQ
jgi:hypothetical protein